MLRYTKHVTSQRYQLSSVQFTMQYCKFYVPLHMCVLQIRNSDKNSLLWDFQNISKCFKYVTGSKELVFWWSFDENSMIHFQFCMLDDWKNFPQTGFWFHVFQTMFPPHHPQPFSARSYSSLSCFHANSGLTLLSHNVSDSKQQMNGWQENLEVISTPNQLAEQLYMDITANNVKIALWPKHKRIYNSTFL